MSDLQCAARVYVARHGEAAYESELLSDHGGSLTDLGRAQARQLAPVSRDRADRQGLDFSALSRAVQTAEIAAAALGCDVVVREGLREFGVGAFAGQPPTPDPLAPTCLAWLDGDLDARVDGGESGAELVGAGARRCSSEVADRHRGRGGPGGEPRRRRSAPRTRAGRQPPRAVRRDARARQLRGRASSRPTPTAGARSVGRLADHD